MKSHLLLIGLGVIFFSHQLEARWATYEDAESEIVFENTEIQVYSDGTYTQTIESQVKLLKDSARDSLTTRRLLYNSNISDLKIIEAKTIKDGKEYLVRKQLIEDKPLASSPHGFDQSHQILIAYPEVQVGSEIYLKYTLHARNSPLPGFFSTSLTYGMESYERSGTVHIASELPLFLGVHDPKHVLKIEQRDEGKLHHLTVTLLEPVYREPVDEYGVHINLKDVPWVDISSSKDWPSIAQSMIGTYEEILNAPLPPLFEKIREQVSQKKNRTEQLNTLTSLLAAEINYLGDWRPVSGLYVPRPLSEIAETKLGDCKDFAATTTAILRKLGFSAQIAWVKRGYNIYESLTGLPILGEFNHAIVHVDSETPLWIDPTNFASYAQGIFPDIADRQALVLDPKKIYMGKIPAQKPIDTQIEISKILELKKKDHFQVHGAIQMKGAAALPYTGVSLKASEQSINYEIIKAMGDENRISHWTVDPYSLSSRIAKDIEFHFQFQEQSSDLRTSSGPGLYLSAGGSIPILLTKTQDRVSDLVLGSPMIFKREIQLKGVKRQGNQSLDCLIRSKWIQASRKVLSTPTGFKVVDQIQTTKSLIPNSDLKSKEYAALQEKLQSCFNGIAVIYSQ